jgi:acyl carrier protein
MKATSVLSRVRDYVTENFLYVRPQFQLGDDDRLLGNGVIDSMGIIELTEFLGTEFGIEVADTEITEANLGTLRSIARYVDSKMAHGDTVAYQNAGVD